MQVGPGTVGPIGRPAPDLRVGTISAPRSLVRRKTTTDARTMTHQTTPDQTSTTTRAKVLDLSLTQLLGGSAAAATAAAGSRLGVVGTIAGAAVLSLVSAIAASLYGVDDACPGRRRARALAPW